MTSTLQQTASTQLGFSPKKTMMVAQKLYEGVKTDKGTMGVITYMRTDSMNLAKEAVESAREHIKAAYGDKYLPAKAKNYVTKSKGAQEAHEAIRPTLIHFDSKMAADYLSVDELKLYRLIYNRFLACQMTEAELESQSILFKGDKCTFKASGRKLLFDGFYKVTGHGDKDKLLPDLEKGQAVTIDEIKQEQHFTEPPARYNEASLIKKLESLGIGRPSTYAPTVTTLQTRKYIELEKKRIHPTEIAFTVTEMLEEHFPEIVDSGFTANMEETLDEVAEGNTDWQTILKAFYTPFLQKVEDGKKNIKSLKVEETDEKCEKCGSMMVIKNSKRGKFLACSAYPKCKNAKSLEPAKELTVPCPECGGKLQEREGRRGKFFGCVNYPKCKFIANFEPVDKKCPECDYTMGIKTLRGKEVYECFKCKHKIEVTESK